MRIAIFFHALPDQSINRQDQCRQLRAAETLGLISSTRSYKDVIDSL